MQIESKAPNDCAIVALTHYFGLPYEEVLLELYAIAKELGIKWNPHKGTPNVISWRFCEKRGLIKRSVPRRGQDKISGLVQLHSAGASSGHMVAMIDGYVFDAIFPDGIPIKEYQQRVTRKHIRGVWS